MWKFLHGHLIRCLDAFSPATVLGAWSCEFRVGYLLLVCGLTLDLRVHMLAPFVEFHEQLQGLLLGVKLRLSVCIGECKGSNDLRSGGGGGYRKCALAIPGLPGLLGKMRGVNQRQRHPQLPGIESCSA
jgi:hypothetical protein